VEIKEFCLVCGRDREYHLSDTVKHQFSLEGQLKAKSPSPAEPSRGFTNGRPSSDPILRLVLIRKGILTIEDLEAAEKELNALGVASVGTVARSSGEDSATIGG